RINSQQSIRIRTLENEGSRLLAENLSLREQVLQLQNALEAQPARPSFENIDSVKDRLEAKIQELGGLVAKLGQLKTAPDYSRWKNPPTATRKSPEERQWRSGLCLQEVENAMLPTIVEDKHYPRRTMKIENEGPIAFDPSPPPDNDMGDQVEEQDPALSINLETRRKRRESGPKLHIRRLSLFEPQPEGAEEKTKAVRTGAKRKFSVQEDNDKPENSPDSFTFTRKNDTQDSAKDESKEVRLRSPERPALGSKPVNTDPILSPKKQRSSAPEKADKKPTTLGKTGRGRSASTRNEISTLPPLQLPTETIGITEIRLDALPPKTPAVEDIFSPPVTEPSASRQESKDTPPPAGIGSSDLTNGARPSRRARPQVSYKEPSLAAKMRRPGKELVDAVQSNRRTSTDPTPSASGSATGKRENKEVDSTWKGLPTKANGGDDEAEIGSPLREKLGRREEGVTIAEPATLNPSAASQTISALMAGSKRKEASTATNTTAATASVRSVEEKPVKKESSSTDKARSKDNLAIFDFTDSSPNDGAAPTRPRIDLAMASRNARRHSSVPASATSEERKSILKRKEDGLPTLHSRAGSGSGASTKASSSTGLSRTSRDRKVNDLPASGSASDLKAAALEDKESKTHSLRAERAASRRKSMMV
ncbi:hypothetical protein BU24DRAFT_345095, partial [Aaosphaeria arxii CBS 175.79]